MTTARRSQLVVVLGLVATVFGAAEWLHWRASRRWLGTPGRPVGREGIVSHALHAEKGRAYLWRQRPDLAERLVRADDYRFGEMILLKPLAVWLGWRNRPRATSSASTLDCQWSDRD